MIEFIILEEQELEIEKYKIIIEKIMMNYDINYKIKPFQISDINNNKSFKVYLIEINSKKDNIKIIEKIREEQDDWQSMIITISNTLEHKQLIMERRLLIVDYIEKIANWEKRLTSAIQICLKNYDQRPNSLKYCYKKIIYNIDYCKILYIEKEQDSKRCIIRTLKDEYYIQGTLNKIELLLDKRFIKCNRSFIINIEQVESYDTKNNIITFKNGFQISVVSRNKRKEIINLLRRVE